MTIWAVQAAAADAHTLDLRSIQQARAAEARRLRQGVRIFRLLGRRCAAGGAERDGRGTPRRRHPHAHARRSAERSGNLWSLTTEHVETGQRDVIQARTLVNAAGPWVAHAPYPRLRGSTPRHAIRLVQGSHIVVPKLFDHDRCYIFQNTDSRIVFAIPYEQDFTLIGTTDQDIRRTRQHPRQRCG
ncbi:MAG: FAD-dependent oxidoreductase [Dongiaceae bacterium]